MSYDFVIEEFNTNEGSQMVARAVVPKKPGPKMTVYFKVDTEAWYDSPGGQKISFVIPAGTKLIVPTSLVYGKTH